jgi:NADPH-dependent 7-cyano-7-deazaguanine reductase QueF-like protein
MQGSYDAICARIGIASTPLGRANTSEHRDYRSYYDQALIDGVARLYARDIELFGYEF